MAWKLILLYLFSLTTAHMLGIVPDVRRIELRRRAVINETLAITSSLLTQYGDEEILKKNLTAIVGRYPDVLSACIRQSNGRIIHQMGPHQVHWTLEPGEKSTHENTYVPISNGKHEWGTVELCFGKQAGPFAALSRHPIILLGLFTAIVNWFTVRWYFKRAFSYLDPAKSVPTHVRSTLDTFSEGVVVLDNDERIVLANDKFKRQTGKTDGELLGKDIDHLPWLDHEDHGRESRWMLHGDSIEGMRLGLDLDQERRTYLVNASAILGNDGDRRGTIASFDDITPLQRKREELNTMLHQLRSSRDELSQRNKELQFLATRDPLTGCLNRRTFFEIFGKNWSGARRHQSPLSAFMVDVDHFKSVNDNHGHSVGDEVLRKVAETIEKSARESDTVCRYGGEEFCMLLPNTDTSDACEIAERTRLAIEALEFEHLSVTASFGVSSIRLGAADPQELLDQADKCLYIAKRAGRNQVVRWDAPPEEDSPEEAAVENSTSCLGEAREDISIPYPAVASLLSALAYRDSATAAHSTRVAELSVAMASGLLSVKDTYVLEVAALLHDIGKVGVPDAILLKPGPLTPEEWDVMHLHDRIGVEIIEASFSNQTLVDIVRCHHASFGPNPESPHLPRGNAIPVGARIVAIADAYDAMISNRVYRKGCPPEQAFTELRKCAGSQFDPELVERFITIVQDHRPTDLAVRSKQTALQIGLQIEKLAEAIDDQDAVGIRALSARLEATAAQGGINEIEAVAKEIRESTDGDGDLITLLELVQELMTLCRSTQKVYADTEFNRRSLEPTLTL